MNSQQVIQTSIVAVLIIAVSGVVAAQAITCSTCADCEAKLNSGLFGTVYLANNIASQSGSCVWVVGQSDVDFDCTGHTIDGDGSGTDYGIAMVGGTGNEVRNCNITDFDTGILLWDTTNHLVVNNITSSNTFGIQINLNASSNRLEENWSFDNATGIRITDSNNNTVVSNDSCSNSIVDIDVAGTSSANTGYGNRCDSFNGWNDNGSIGCSHPCSYATFEQLTACTKMRRVGTALMSWLTDQISENGGFVKAPDFIYDLSALDVISVYQITDMLQPLYWPGNVPIPAIDPWGMPYEYRLNSNLLASNVLAIRTPGADAQLEGLVYTSGLVPTEAADIVWADGYMVRWPATDCSGLLFADGFDSGTTAMWSITAP